MTKLHGRFIYPAGEKVETIPLEIQTDDKKQIETIRRNIECNFNAALESAKTPIRVKCEVAGT